MEVNEIYEKDSVILNVYSNLRELIKNKSAEQKNLYVQEYLEKYFYNKKTGWYDNHKSKHETYYGYWSFESAAIVSMLDLDDSSFRDNQYYPKDLVDYYRSTMKDIYS